MEHFNIYELAGHLAYIIFTGSYLFKDIMWLRIATIIGCIIIFFYDYNIAGTPLWTLIIWNTLCLTINIVQVLILFRERYGTHLSKHEKEIYHYFSIMPVNEFKKLLKIANIKKFPEKSVLLEQNKQVDKLIFIVQGQVSVLRDGREVDISSDGHFIGEMVFVNMISDSEFIARNASATIEAINAIEIVEWSFTPLKKLFSQNQNIENLFLAMIAKNMCYKLNSVHNTKKHHQDLDA